MVSCSRCGKTLTDPKSIQRGMGPVCAGKEYGSGLNLNQSGICPYCGGTIEKVELGQFAWMWTCGGVSGNGCHSDYGTNTPAPLAYQEGVDWLKKFKPHKFENYRREREFHREVANRTFARLGVRAVPPYPGPMRIHGVISRSFLSETQTKEIENRENAIMIIKNEVWKDFHEMKGRYGRHVQFYDPEMGHCKKCGVPTKKVELVNGAVCSKCLLEEKFKKEIEK